MVLVRINLGAVGRPLFILLNPSRNSSSRVPEWGEKISCYSHSLSSAVGHNSKFPLLSVNLSILVVVTSSFRRGRAASLSKLKNSSSGPIVVSRPRAAPPASAMPCNVLLKTLSAFKKKNGKEMVEECQQGTRFILQMSGRSWIYIFFDYIIVSSLP